MIKIVICKDRSAGLFWDALSAALSRVPRFSIKEIDDAADIRAVIRSHEAVLLICGSGPGVSHRELFAEQPGLAIMRVDEDSAKTVVRTSQSVPIETRISVDDPDYELFVRLVERLFPSGEEEPKPKLRLLRPDDISGDPAAPEHVNRGPPRFTERDEAEFHEHAERWVTLVLLDRLAPALAAETNAQARIAGFGLSVGDAITLLAGKAGAPQEERRSAELRRLEPMVFEDPARPVTSSFQWTARAFSLTRRQQQILLLAAAPEFNGRFGRVYGCLNDDLTRRHLCLALLAELPLFDRVAARTLYNDISSDTPLNRFGLASVNDSPLPFTDSPISVPRDLLRFIGGERGDTPTAICTLHTPHTTDHEGRSTKALRARLERWIARAEDTGSAPTLNLDSSQDTLTWFIRGAREFGLSVVEVDLQRLSAMPVEQAYSELLYAARSAALNRAIVLVTNPDVSDDATGRVLESLAVATLGSRVRFLAILGRFRSVGNVKSMSRIARPAQDASDRMSLWLDYADRLGIALSDEHAAELGEWARFTEADIEQTLYFARDKVMDLHLFKKAARHVSTTGVPASVRRLPANFDWDDIVLPAKIFRQLRHIPDHVTCRETVLGTWGYRERLSYGLGTACLFSGPSGTGKTMASQVIAHAIGDSEIFQCDLAKTVSKYIGESEKNLDVIFEAAEKSRAVLVFDEADVLFGKRTEIRDAHDRYANLEVGYLLQRMEAYEGLVILTTNSRSSMDTSFLRRLRFIVEFPVPSPEDREKIWQRVFPNDLPRADDVSLTYLARQLDLTGGHIQQIAVMSAYAAAAEGCERVCMRHIVSATRDELAKLGMDSANRILDEMAA